MCSTGSIRKNLSLRLRMIERAGSLHAEMRRHGVPCGAGIELTAACNLDCVHCYHVRSAGPEMNRDEIERLLGDLAALGVLELTFTGGEPFTRPDFPSILRSAITEHGFSVKIFSNLTLLDAPMAEFLAGFPLNRVETTLLGDTAVLHDSLTRRPGSFGATLAGIRLLRERGVRVAAKTVVMRPNSRALPGLYRLAESLGIPFRHDDGIFVESDGGRRPLGLRITEEEARRARRKRGWREPDAVSGACNAAKSVVHIAPDGAVYPCGPFPFSVGNVRETPLVSLWRDASLMRRVRALADKDYGACRGCRYLVWCGGCMAMGLGLARGRKYPCRVVRRRLREFA
jgi:radical SAM protein with 4Fe4S-binding SPASM domain